MKFVRSFLIVILILFTIRLLLPVVALAGANYALRNKIENYVGEAKGLDLAILRGAVKLKDISLERRDKPETFNVGVGSISANLSWQDLWNKKAIVNLYIDKIDIVLTELPDEPPKPEDMTYTKLRKILADSKWSSEINKFEIRNSSIKFQVPKAKSPLSVSHIDVDAYNLHFSPDKEWQISDFAVRGRLQGQGEMKLNGKIQPLALPPMADINFTLVDFDMRTLNGLMLKVLPLDITRGKLSTYIEAATEKGHSNGYAKIFLDDVDVVASEQKFKSGRHALIEAGSAIGNWVLKNKKEKTMAINVPFNIDHKKLDLDKSAAIASAIRNQRDELDRKLDNSVSFAQNRNETLMR